MWISWVDREGAIFSSAFSFFKDLPLALVLLLVLQRFGRRQWGYISELTGSAHTVSLHPMNVDGTLSEEEIGVKFHPEDRIHSGWSLLGRATTVVGASREEGSGGIGDRGEAVGAPVKDIPRNGSEVAQQTLGEVWSVKDGDGAGDTAQSERDPSGTTDNQEADEALRVFNQARNAYRKAFGKTIKVRNLVLKISWPEASRPAEWRIIGRTHALGKSDKFIEGHIPVVRYARDLDRYSTRHIRNFLRLWTDEGPGTRTLRLIVMNRLRPIHDLDGKEFWDAFWQCFACMCFLGKSNSRR